MQENYSLLEQATLDQETHRKNISLLSSLSQIPWDNLEYDFWQYYKESPAKINTSLRSLIGLSLIKKYFSSIPVDIFSGIKTNEIWQAFCGLDFNVKEFQLNDASFFNFFNSLSGPGFHNLDYIIHKYIDPTFQSDLKSNDSALFFGRAKPNRQHKLNEERYLHGSFQELSDTERKKNNNSLSQYL